jgi:hypothetical protein
MYTREEFVERFKGMETAWLVDRLATSEPTDDARAAIHDVLRGRGVTPDSLHRLEADIPAHEIVQYARAIKASSCPRCRRNDSGIEVRRSYRVWSALVLTRWETRTALCCRMCSEEENWKALIFSFGLGWWGFPFGLIVTPFQIIRNILAIARKDVATEPSMDLLNVAKQNLLAQRQHEIERTAR